MGKQSTQVAGRRSVPKFITSPDGKIAGDSVEDSGIFSCNKNLEKQLQKKLAREIWDLAKQLGAVAEDVDEITQRIEELENRDSRAKADMANQATEGGRKVSEDINDYIVI